MAAPRGLEAARAKSLAEAEKRRMRRIELREIMANWAQVPEDSWREHLKRHAVRADPSKNRLVSEFPQDSEPFEVFEHIGWGSYRTNHLADKNIFIIDDYLLSNEFYYTTSYVQKPKFIKFWRFYQQKKAQRGL